MSLSDEILRERAKLRNLRARLLGLVADTGATAAFLVDEEGHPFATVGHIEFELPHPVASILQGGSADADALLGALVGEQPRQAAGHLVDRAGPRALVVLVHPAPSAPERRSLSRAAEELARLL